MGTKFTVATKTISHIVFTALILLCWPLVATGQESIFADNESDARIAEAISEYRKIVARVGWPAISPGPPLKRGVTGDRVAVLRHRLTVSGDLPSSQRTGRHFDHLLKRAVKSFQERHGLLVDGIAGSRTLMALNVPADRRLAALSINRSRLKKWQNQIRGTGVIVNIPDATLELLENGRRVLRSPVVVGRPDWPTPTLRSVIYAIDVNPVWYVPDRIALQEILPYAKRDPEYLEQRGIRVFSKAGAGRKLRELPYNKINFSHVGNRHYRLRQDAGPLNPLGVVKFVFNNPHSVFLHDTPNRQSFSRSKRSVSHGCVRVASALGLAKHFAVRDPGIGSNILAAAIRDGKTVRLRLSQPIPIHLVYFTAWVDHRKRVQFRRDIYGYDRPGALRDPALAACGDHSKWPEKSG